MTSMPGLPQGEGPVARASLLLTLILLRTPGAFKYPGECSPVIVPVVGRALPGRRSLDPSKLPVPSGTVTAKVSRGYGWIDAVHPLLPESININI